MIDLKWLLKCKDRHAISVVIDLFNFRYDVSGDGQIDQKELANLIAAMVKSLHPIDQKTYHLLVV